MNNAIRVILTLIGVVLLAVSIVGLTNSDLDSREILLVASGYGGAALFALGVRRFVQREPT